MRYTEILLIIVIVILLTLPGVFLKRVNRPVKTYVELAIGFILLILVWFFTNEGALPLRIIVTAVVIKNAVKTLDDHNKSNYPHK